jgi:hypothetical protein
MHESHLVEVVNTQGNLIMKKCTIKLLRMQGGEHRGVKDGCLELELETLEHNKLSVVHQKTDSRFPCLSQSDKTTTKAGSL